MFLLQKQAGKLYFMGLRKSHRLKNPADFARLRENGRVYRHKMMLMSVLPNTLSHNRYGIITSRRVGNAVTRNHLRRLIREIIRHQHPTLKQGYDIAIIVHPSCKGKPYQTIQRVLVTLWNNASLVVSRE